MLRLILLVWLGVLLRNELVQGQGLPMENNVKTCTADTSGWVRRGNYLRERGDCQQGYICDGPEIKPFRAPCREPSYMSVHTGTCSFPNVYTYIFGSFNCSAEEDDPDLDFEKLIEKRYRACEPLMANADPDTTELYAGDPDNCRMMFKCPMTAEHDEWLHLCPVGMRFDASLDQLTEGACVPDDSGCYSGSK